MPRQSIDGFRATDRWMGDEPFYTAADIAEILQQAPSLPPGDVTHKRVRADATGWDSFSVPRAVALVERLESAAGAYHLWELQQQLPTYKQRAERFRRIRKAASVLLEELGTPTAKLSKMPVSLKHSMPLSLAEDLRAVGRLQRWARQNAAYAKSRPAARYEGDEALDAFVECLAGIWRDVFNLKPGRTVNRRGGERRDGGPFVRFVAAALKPLRGNVPPDELIADRVKKLQDMGKLGGRETE